MGLLDVVLNSVLGDVAVGATLLVSVLPILGLATATEELVAMGLPRSVVGSVAAVLMVVWMVALLAFVATRIDWG
jgi:hypothetical protein